MEIILYNLVMNCVFHEVRNMFELELFDKIPMSVYKLIYEQTFES